MTAPVQTPGLPENAVKVGAWTWTVWPTFPTPTEDYLRALGQRRGLHAIDAYHAERERLIRLEQDNPLSYGWEQPPVRIVRQLLAGTYGPGQFGVSVAPAGWRQEKPANDLLMMGGNGSGKSEIEAKIGMETITAKPHREWRAFSQNEQTSVRYIQKPTAKYLPPDLRRIKKQGQTTKISYSESTGFSEGVFILPNHSATFFPTYKAYEQDKNSVEGGEADIATWDEEAPAELLKTLRFRVHKKGGFLLGGVTFVGGYTETAAEYIDGCVILEAIPCRAVVWDFHQPVSGRQWSWGKWLLPPDQELVKGCPPGHVPFVVQSGGGSGRRFAVALPTVFNPYTNVDAIIESTACGEWLQYQKLTADGLR